MSNEYRQELARSLTLRENIFITLSTVTPASSVFIIIPSLIVGLAGGSVAAMVIAAFLAIFVGLCYAELSSRWPISGGEYTWAARLLGKPMGFGVLTLSLMAGILIISVIGSGVGTYLSVVWAGFNSPWTTIIVIVITTVVACFTIKANAWVTGIFLGLEVLTVLVLVVLGFSHIQRGFDTFVTPQSLGASGGLEPVTWGVLFSLVSVALFAYGGYGTAVFYSEETKNASKTMARAVMVSLLVTVLVELLPVMAVILGADSLESLMASEAPMNEFLLQRGGETVNMLVSIGIAIAVFNAVIAIQIQNARLVFASARDRSWPVGVDRLLGSINARTKSPIAATVLVGVLAAAAGYLLPFGWLIVATSATVVVIYVAIAFASLRARSASGGRPDHYRMPLWPLPPLIVIAFMAYVLYKILATDPTPLIVAVASILVGVIWYAIFIRPKQGERWTLPEPQADEN